MQWTAYEFEEIPVTVDGRTLLANGLVNIRYTMCDPDRSVGETCRYPEIHAYDDIDVEIYDEDADDYIKMTVKAGHPMHAEIIAQLDEDFISEKCMEDD